MLMYGMGHIQAISCNKKSDDVHKYLYANLLSPDFEIEPLVDALSLTTGDVAP